MVGVVVVVVVTIALALALAIAIAIAAVCSTGFPVRVVDIVSVPAGSVVMAIGQELRQLHGGPPQATAKSKFLVDPSLLHEDLPSYARQSEGSRPHGEIIVVVGFLVIGRGGGGGGGSGGCCIRVSSHPGQGEQRAEGKRQENPRLWLPLGMFYNW